MTREALRRKRVPYYQKKSFIISIVSLVIILIGIFVIWKANSSKDTHSTQPSHKIEKVKPKKTEKKKVTKKANKPKTVKKENPAQQVTKEPEKKPATVKIQNAGSYNDLTYDSDWYTFKISNEVKLIKDSNGDAALLVKYNYTNKTKSAEVPQKVQSNAIMLKQDGQQLSAVTATGDNAALIDSSNNGLVQPEKNFDGALLVKVNSTTSEVTMYFKNIETNNWLDSTQPLKLD
ncbi:hypothetical protein IV57_GL000475 [Companilactobacillus kimchiensis]|uniref:DUF5067 domain-containing protein n=2 Tax=Companilactobacillus kimchiensis TaxID=993692 RepID=A0A0R2LHB8_9LACO|nr:hypothetical protein IV57_GL000475 [Companilactobacillus kimchiensis]